MADERVRRGLLREIASVEESYSLQRFNPLRAGGVADFFCEAKDAVELAAAIKAATDTEVPYLVIGQGDGVLFSDGGFPGLVIQNRAESFAFSEDKSQCVVDSGMSLTRFIAVAASRGFGGLTHLYGEGGTVGGAPYANLRGPELSQPILSSLRYATMLMPPTRIEKEATIVRYKPDWFKRPDDQTRLQHLKATKPLAVPQPVILTAMFQLTRVRTDELMARLHVRAKQEERLRPRQALFGPVFQPLPNVEVSELLTGAGATGLRVGDVYVDRYFPNYLACRGKTASSREIRELIELMRERVSQVYSAELACRYEFLGVW